MRQNHGINRTTMSDRRHVRRAGIVVNALLALVAMSAIFAVPASAATSITPNPIPVSAGQSSATVTFTYSGLPAGKRLFVTQCRKPDSDPTFQFAADCSNLSEVQRNPVDNPNGSGTFQFSVFRGAEPSGDVNWGCFAAGDTKPAGVAELTTTCYLRITADSEENKTDAQSAAFTFTAQGAPVPEIGLTVLLPVAAVVVGGLGIALQRRRRTAAV